MGIVHVFGIRALALAVTRMPSTAGDWLTRVIAMPMAPAPGTLLTTSAGTLHKSPAANTRQKAHVMLQAAAFGMVSQAVASIHRRSIAQVTRAKGAAMIIPLFVNGTVLYPLAKTKAQVPRAEHAPPRTLVQAITAVYGTDQLA